MPAGSDPLPESPATPGYRAPREPSAIARGAPASLYLHIPFCAAKCSYCDFDSYPLASDWYAPYVHALAREIRAVGAEWQGPPIETIYVGGGTPTVLPPALLGDLSQAVGRAFRLSPGMEMTVEANPGTVTRESLAQLRGMGVSRLSLGVQSFQPQLLRLLGRTHSAAQATEAVSLARRAGLDDLNLDLIYGLPGQTAAQWRADLEAALALQPDHLSLYALTLEPGTPLSTHVSCGKVPPPDADLAADMYQEAEQRLANAGYVHYEISNWARTDARRCRHNLTYWLNLPYAGVGAAAHSWLHGCRRANVRTPGEYIDRVQSGRDLVAEVECIAPELERAETMILGLRLVQGVSRAGFASRFGVDPTELYAAAIEETEALGLIEVLPAHVRLTARGRLLGNQAFWRFLPS